MRDDPPLRRELFDELAREDHDVAGRAFQVLLAHRAHRAEDAFDLDASALRLARHQRLCGARAHESQFHRSGFAPEIFTMRAHFSMSSRR